MGNEIITQLQKDMTKYHGNKLGAGHHTQMTGVTTQTIGRFPANTILTYDEKDFEEVCGGFPNTKSTLGPAYYKGNYTKNGWKNTSKQNTSEVIYNDSGSASRYFYCAKRHRQCFSKRNNIKA